MFKEKPSMTKKQDRPVKEKVTQKPLLIIELEEETSVPKVFYKGEEVTMKARILFEWETGNDDEKGGTRYNIEHFEKVHKGIVRKGYGLAKGKYALDGEDG